MVKIGSKSVWSARDDRLQRTFERTKKKSPTMPLADGPVSSSRYEDESHMNSPAAATARKKSGHKPGREGADVEAIGSGPMSPRVRKRLDEAKENASVFGPVCEQGEVVQWMTACHPRLVSFGRDLERRGFTTLSSIAFLTEDELDPSIDLPTRQLLLATLARLRHEFFRM